MKIRVGPGALVAAAFIGPGTVTTCTLAGANFGFALIWALVFATVATILLQDMAARLGAGGRLGLGEAMMGAIQSRPLRLAAAGLVLLAIGVGNAAYEAGNLAGGALGLAAIFGDDASQRLFVLTLSVIAAGILILGRYRQIEGVLIILVAFMSLSFLASTFIVAPDWGALAGGLVPRIPNGGVLTAVALIGTTIVPYNLFLHAAAAKERWSREETGDARADTAFSIGVGGLVSIAIVATSATALFGSALAADGPAMLARTLEPVYGTFARYLIGAGLFAAGLTSAVTAPLAAGYALSEILSLQPERRGQVVRLTALAVLAIGAGVALIGLKPLTLIMIAQAANGLLLPIIAIFLLMVMNKAALLGDYRNRLLANILGAGVVVIAAGLGIRGLLRAFGAL
ncbi:MAG: divalent metal cation transporter [Pseudomonadota bacterium]